MNIESAEKFWNKIESANVTIRQKIKSTILHSCYSTTTVKHINITLGHILIRNATIKKYILTAKCRLMHFNNKMKKYNLIHEATTKNYRQYFNRLNASQLFFKLRHVAFRYCNLSLSHMDCLAMIICSIPLPKPLPRFNNLLYVNLIIGQADLNCSSFEAIPSQRFMSNQQLCFTGPRKWGGGGGGRYRVTSNRGISRVTTNFPMLDISRV